MVCSQLGWQKCEDFGGLLTVESSGMLKVGIN